MEPIRPVVVVVSRDPDVVRSVQGVFSEPGQVVELFVSLQDVLNHTERRDGPQCLLLVLDGSSSHNVVELLRALRADGDPVPMIVIAERETDLSVLTGMIRAGAVDLLCKPVDALELKRAVVRVAPLAQKLWEERGLRRRAHARFSTLTPREREVCFELSRGLLNKQVAAQLGISEKTVKYHRAQIVRKLGVSSIAELVRMVDLIDASKFDPPST